MDIGAAWHQRSSWARVHSLSCHRKPGFSTVEFCGQIPWIWHVLAGFTVNAICCLALSLSQGGFFDRFSNLLLTGTSPKSCLGATSDLDEFFKTCQIFVDNRMPLQKFLRRVPSISPNSKIPEIVILRNHKTSFFKWKYKKGSRKFCLCHNHLKIMGDACVMKFFWKKSHIVGKFPTWGTFGLPLI